MRKIRLSTSLDNTPKIVPFALAAVVALFFLQTPTDAYADHNYSTLVQSGSPAFVGTSSDVSILFQNTGGSRDKIGSFTIVIPGSFIDIGIPTPSPPPGKTWSCVLSGSTVKCKATRNASMLTGSESLSVSITSRPTLIGAFTWETNAFHGSNFKGKQATISGSQPTVIVDVLPLLQGPSNDPANEHIPDIRFQDPPVSDLVTSGIPISVRDLIVIFSDSATVGQVNSLLQSFPAEIVGGNPFGSLLLIRLVGPSDFSSS